MVTTLPNTLSPVKCAGVDLDMREDAFGHLRESNDVLGDTEALRSRLEEDGYLFLPGFLNKEHVLEARAKMVGRLLDQGSLETGTNPMDGILREGAQPKLGADTLQHDPLITRILYGERVTGLYEELLGHEILHFDYTWFRCMGRGNGSWPHCDIVYMGRGTKQLYTAWVPYGHVPHEVGGLILLEDSHKKQDRLKAYLEMDVDTYCTNGRHARAIESGERQWEHLHNGALSNNPHSLQKHLGGRWLTAEFLPGDFLTFGMATVHGGADNQTNRVRLSSDSRYQRADQPADERWIGANPIGHGLAGKRGMIC